MNGLSDHHQTLVEALTPTARRIAEFVALACTTTARSRLENLLSKYSIPPPTRNHFTIELLALLSLLPSSAGWRAIVSEPRLRATAMEIVNDQCKGVLSFFGALDGLRSTKGELLTDRDLLDIVDHNDLAFYIGDALDYARGREKKLTRSKSRTTHDRITTRDLLLSFLNYEVPFWIVNPSPLASALWPNGETELCNFIHEWNDQEPEARFARDLTLEVRHTRDHCTVSLLSSSGVFPQFEIRGELKSVQSSLFVACKPPLFLQSEVSEFEEIINSSKEKRELRIQRFLEQQSHFLRVLGFQGFSPQVHLIRQDIDGNSNKRANLYPDFLVKDLGIGRHAVIELKRAQEIMSAGPADRRTFSARLHRALSQLEDYSTFFDDSRNRVWFEEKYGVEISKPELVLIIGNDGLSTNFPYKIAHTPLEGRPVRVLTYDYILNLVRAHHLVFPEEGIDIERG